MQENRELLPKAKPAWIRLIRRGLSSSPLKCQDELCIKNYQQRKAERKPNIRKVDEFRVRDPCKSLAR